MSLKGTEITSEMITLYEMKSAWDNYDPKKYGGAGKRTGEDAFPLFLCRHINSLRGQIASQEKLANKWRKQRNAGIAVCLLLLAASLILIFQSIF